VTDLAALLMGVLSLSLSQPAAAAEAALSVDVRRDV
jgi:hypothetical protein